MSNFVASSNFTKMLANLFVFCTLLGAIVVAIVDTLSNHAIPDTITVVLGSGLGYALNLLGVHQGTSLFLANGATAGTPASVASEAIDQQTTMKLPAVPTVAIKGSQS